MLYLGSQIDYSDGESKSLSTLMVNKVRCKFVVLGLNTKRPSDKAFIVPAKA